MSVYEIWEKSKATRPPRSRLYSLEPRGLGTPQVESLLSYLQRLAVTHSVRVTKLIKNEIVPLCRPGRSVKIFLGEKGCRLHGTSSLAQEVVWALQRLTGQLALPYLTFLLWADVMRFKDVLRPERAWCSACLEAQRQTQMDITESILWALEPIQICPQHQQRLQNVCPHCQKTLPWLTTYSRPGYCSACHAWLGIVPHPADLSLSNLTEDELHWQHWLIEAVGNLLVAGPALASLPTLEWVSRGLLNYCAQVAGGSLERLTDLLQAHQLNLSFSRLKDWSVGKRRPPFMAVFELCYCLQTEPLHFLTDATAAREPVPLRSLNFKRSQLRGDQPPPEPEKLSQTLDTILGQTPPLSLSQVARQLGLNGTYYLTKYCPEQAASIKKQYRLHVQTRQVQRIQALRQEVRQAVLDIHAQGLNPTLGRLCTYVGQHNKYALNPDVRDAWKEARRELGLED
jgi:hypothetical protein